jgi:hypothetical protein
MAIGLAHWYSLVPFHWSCTMVLQFVALSYQTLTYLSSMVWSQPKHW